MRGEKMVHDWILATPFYLEAFKAIEMVGEFLCERLIKSKADFSLLLILFCNINSCIERNLYLQSS